ncbi:hypothetical protein GKA01_25620 [Gluconobacter kanchanaburiensis NBRC 103587]|uniref:Uncharacterized protein n=1 Tax=Gluconobacter kanchanaburiensis NBRC 103587 TaxID=1307948 RepID=A0A511BAC4_9PROT|nr:hypothetical protein GKA01_25620 [Gluconobacter kanchanaburiensis NBRC 103587]
MLIKYWLPAATSNNIVIDTKLPRHITVHPSLQDGTGNFTLCTGTPNKPGTTYNRIELGEEDGEVLHRFRRKISINDLQAFLL